MWVTKRKRLDSESLDFYYPIRLSNYFFINKSHNKPFPARTDETSGCNKRHHCELTKKKCSYLYIFLQVQKPFG